MCANLPVGLLPVCPESQNLSSTLPQSPSPSREKKNLTLCTRSFPNAHGARTWLLRPPPSTPTPRRLLLPRQSPRLRVHPHRIKRFLLHLMPLSPMRLRLRPRPRQPRLLRPCPCPRQRRGSGSSRKQGSTPPNTTRSVPSSPTCVSASSRFILNIFFFLCLKIPQIFTRASCVLLWRRQSWSL